MRYLLFGSEEIYYARGGGWDFLEQSDDLSELLDDPKIVLLGDTTVIEVKWWHIFDTKAGEIVLCSPQQPYGTQDHLFEDMVESK